MEQPPARLRSEALAALNVVRLRNGGAPLPDLQVVQASDPVADALRGCSRIDPATITWRFGTVRWWRPAGTYTILTPAPAIVRLREWWLRSTTEEK